MPKKKILLIDDSATILMLERQILGQDYDIVTASDGRSGVAKARAERPDLILLDLVMPGANGLDVCATLRSEEATRQTPIVVVTSLTEAQGMTADHRTGWSGHVAKPIRGPELLAAVKRLLGDNAERGRAHR